MISSKATRKTTHAVGVVAVLESKEAEGDRALVPVVALAREKLKEVKEKSWTVVLHGGGAIAILSRKSRKEVLLQRI